MQMTMVSIKGPIMRLYPRARPSVLAAEWAMAADPIPASLEKAARVIPMIATPSTPSIARPVFAEDKRKHRRNLTDIG